jgi:hypothetical protein
MFCRSEQAAQPCGFFEDVSEPGACLAVQAETDGDDLNLVFDLTVR